jgi:hypothetical protein
VSGLETAIRESAASGEWVADWNDVLRRSGYSRFRSIRAAAIAAVVAAAVVLLAPGIGIGGGLKALISGSRRPGLEVRAELVHAGRTIGFVSIQTTSRAAVSVAPQGGRLPPVPVAWPELRWGLRLPGATTVSSLRIVQPGRAPIRLCGPCRDGANGTLPANRTSFAAAFGRGTVVADTSRGKARGTLRIEPPTS